jgi:hypothetical protein
MFVAIRIKSYKSLDHMANVITQCAKRNIAVSKAELTPYILGMANSRPRTNTFHNNQISASWWTEFFSKDTLN